MLSSTAQRRKQIARDWSNEIESGERFVDIGVDLHIVRADPNGKVLFPGGLPMVVVDRRHYGGMLDTAANPPCIPEGEAGWSQKPQQWFCGEDQFAVIEHRDDEPVGKLALGGMGAGKTTSGVIWLYLRWLEAIQERVDAAKQTGRYQSAKEGGITAPTETRLMAVLNEMFDRFPRTWWTFNSETKIVTMADKFRWRGVSTHRQSEKQGSRVQQFNWVSLFMDELQDQVDEFVNAQARLRSKANGRAKRIATATAKDFPEWRTLKDGMLGTGHWLLHFMIGPRSPFIHPSHWETMKASTTERDYRRLVLAEDIPPESRLYNTFDRKFNVRQIPQIGVRKITSLVISKKIGGENWGVGIGHDPGAAKAGSVWLDAYELSRQAAQALGAPEGEPVWFVRHEKFTLHKSAEEHALAVLSDTREIFGCNLVPNRERAHVRCQPLGVSEDNPDLEVMKVWERLGFHIRAAQYSETRKMINGVKTTGVGQIKKNSRIAVVCTLFCNAYGQRRLFLECDEKGACRTPKLLEALESMERDEMGRAEWEAKNIKYDQSDLPAALGYWLWPFEKQLASALRAEIRRAM